MGLSDPAGHCGRHAGAAAAAAAEPLALLAQTERLHRQLGAVVDELRVLTGRGALPRAVVPDAPDEQRRLAAYARHLSKLRRARTATLGDLFGEPIWDMLLDLYLAHEEGRRVSIKGACLASGAPDTTALRYMQTLLHAGLAVRERDAKDGRRVFLALTPDGVSRMRRVLLDGLLCYERQARQSG